MKYEVELNGRFTADIHYFSTRCELYFEGEKLASEGKNTFVLGEEKIKIGGTLFSGIYLIRGEEQKLIFGLKWYDFLIGLIPFFVGLIGGLIGALLGAACFLLCYKIMPYVKNFFLRLLVCLGVGAALLLVILLLASAFPSLFGLNKPQ